MPNAAAIRATRQGDGHRRDAAALGPVLEPAPSGSEQLGQPHAGRLYDEAMCVRGHFIIKTQLRHQI